MADGRSRPEIGTDFGVWVDTVASIGKRVYATLGVGRRAQLAGHLRLGGWGAGARRAWEGPAARAYPLGRRSFIIRSRTFSAGAAGGVLLMS